MDSIQYFCYVYQTEILVVLTACALTGLMIKLVCWSGRDHAGKYGDIISKLGGWLFVLSVVVCGLAVIAMPGGNFPKEHLRQETVPVAKVSHINGSENYLVQSTSGEKYNLDENEAIINTANHSSAKLVRYVKPAAGTKQRKLYDKAIENGDISESTLKMDLTAKDYGKHAVTWNFN